jgi:hypothetical protein
LFQSDIPLLYMLKSEVNTLLISLLSDFMEITFVRQMKHTTFHFTKFTSEWLQQIPSIALKMPLAMITQMLSCSTHTA